MCEVRLRWLAFGSRKGLDAGGPLLLSGKRDLDSAHGRFHILELTSKRRDSVGEENLKSVSVQTQSSV